MAISGLLTPSNRSRSKGCSSNEIMYIQNQFNLLNVDITRLMKDFPIIHFTRGNIPKVFVNLIRGTYTSEIKSCLNMLRIFVKLPKLKTKTYLTSLISSVAITYNYI